jgi:hypothetical protein
LDISEFDLMILEGNVTSVSDDRTGAATGGYLLVDGPINRISVRPGENDFFAGEPFGLTVRFDIPLESSEYFILPLHHYKYQKWMAESEYDMYDCWTFLVLTRSKEMPGCYFRCGIAWADLPLGHSNESKKFNVVQDTEGIPCEEFYSPVRGHRIRIL